MKKYYSFLLIILFFVSEPFPAYVQLKSGNGTSSPILDTEKVELKKSIKDASLVGILYCYNIFCKHFGKNCPEKHFKDMETNRLKEDEFY